MQEMIYRNDKEWVRCRKCGHKLFKGAGGWHEVKCHSCKEINDVGSEYDKLIFLLEKSGIPFRSIRMVENEVTTENLIVLLNNDEKAEYEANMSFDAEAEFTKLKEAYGFFTEISQNAHKETFLNLGIKSY